jgi:hypothetical protein
MLGKVVQLRGDTAVIDAGGNVDVILNRVSLFLSSLGTPSFHALIPVTRKERRCRMMAGIAEEGRKKVWANRDF